MDSVWSDVMRIGLGLGIAMQKMPPSFIPGLSWSVTASDGTITVIETPSAPVTPAIASVGDGTITLAA